MRFKIIFIFIICLSLVFCVSPQKKLEKARQKDPRYQYNLGLFYLNRGNTDQAIKYFNRTLTLSARYFLAFNGLGLAYSMKGELQESLKYFQKCLELNPRFTEARNNLGIIYQEMGFIDKAEEEYMKVISDQSYKSKENAYYNLSNLYFTQDRFEEALDYAQRATTENRRFAMAHNLKGLILEKLKKLPQAIKSYKQALKIVPSEPNFSFNLAVALFKNREFSKAKEIFKKIYPQVVDPEIKDKINQYLKMIK